MQSYKDLLQHVLVHGEQNSDRTGIGTRSIFGLQWRHNMAAGFPLLTTKSVPFRWVATELEWMLRGQYHNQWLKDRGVDIWDEWATQEQCAKFGRETGDLGPIYGPMWRYYPTGFDYTRKSRGQTGSGFTDQIAMLIDNLLNSPNSRRHIVTGWHPHYANQVALPPCHTLWQIKRHEKTHELSLHLYARSIDIFLGLPFDIAAYALLLKILCKRVGCIARELIISFGDLHLYNNHVEQAHELLRRECRPLPELTITEVQSNLMGFCYTLEGYNPHPKIKADVAV